MSKHLLVVGNAYMHKNKLQKLILDKVAEVNQTLHPTLEAATAHVREKYDEAIAEYPGKCTPPTFRAGCLEKNYNHISVGELISVTAYKVLPIKKSKK